ncbi:MAG: hypothetical protein RL329_3193, partial [Bacteroidota bacterium]
MTRIGRIFRDVSFVGSTLGAMDVRIQRIQRIFSKKIREN